MEFILETPDCGHMTITTNIICVGGCEMEGPCEHQQSCRKCGNGFGCAPDPCNTTTLRPDLETTTLRPDSWGGTN